MATKNSEHRRRRLFFRPSLLFSCSIAGSVARPNKGACGNIGEPESAGRFLVCGEEAGGDPLFDSNLS